MITMETICFAVGLAIGVVFASVVLTVTLFIEEMSREKKRMARA